MEILIKKQLKNNWKSGLSVAMVSIPLSLSLAIAAGASPMTGIITAVWASIIAGIIGGSKYNIIGPAGALTGILISYSLVYGPTILPILAIFSGIIILIVRYLKWDKYLVFVPSSVVHGFTLGVSLTIVASQLNSIFGLNNLPTHSDLVMNIIESFKHIALINWYAFIPFVVSLVAMFVILKYKPKLPNAIIVALFGILLGYLSMHGILPFHFETIGTKYSALSNNLFLFPHLSTLFSNTSFSALIHIAQITLIIKSALIVAFIALLETLISAKIADGMTKTKFNQSKEILGLGFSNIISGIFGGLPASGVFARTSLNVRSGAKSNYSQIIQGVSVGLIAILFISEFSYLPLSVTAAILVYTAVRMITAEHFIKIFKIDKNAFIIAMVVAILTFSFDAATGIVVGALASLLIFANKLSNTTLGSKIDPENFSPEIEKENAITYRFAGVLTYFNAQNHIECINLIRKDKPMLLNFRYLHHIDVDGYQALEEIINILKQRKQPIFITGVKPETFVEFNKQKWFRELNENKKVFLSNDKVLKLITANVALSQTPQVNN